MPPAQPPRRFAPEPIEITTKSSKAARQHSPEKHELAMPPRRFAPQPIETTSKSSKQSNIEGDSKPKPRRFAPQPVETSHTRSKNKQEQNDKPKPRRFAPQLEETSHTINKGKDGLVRPGHVKFAPQPVETPFRGNRKARDSEAEVSPKEQSEKTAPRKFIPILVDTAKRSRRMGDTSTTVSQDLKTESGHYLHAREHRTHILGDHTPPGEGCDEVDIEKLNQEGRLSRHHLELHPELRREVSPMDGAPRALPLTPQRQHSFRCPELDTIEFSESEHQSHNTSLSSSPGQGSHITTSDSSFADTYKHATRIRESIDEDYAHYMLHLEQKRAEEKLREQALAAFPNSDFHEPVAHYLDRDDDSSEPEIEDRPVTWEGHDEDLLLEMAARRESTAKVNWEQMELQRHAEERERERNAAKTTNKQPSQSPWWDPAATYGINEPDPEMKSMRDRARPPMLGEDLVFPRSSSPEPARFDVTQGSTVLRNQMCYLTEHAEAEKRRTGEEGALWQAPGTKPATSTKTTTASSKSASPKGLWGGFCVDDSEQKEKQGLLAPPSAQTGLMTPAPQVEPANPFERAFTAPRGSMVTNGGGLKTLPSPAIVTGCDLNAIDTVLSAEQELDLIMQREFPDSFITQVYNYLSLGYPSLARPFDEELSKISRISMAQLRQDDQKAKHSPRGYIRLGSDFEGGGGEGFTEQSCVRWQSLKLYIREWARQEKNMVKVDGLGGMWGTGARRGSWAI